MEGGKAVFYTLVQFPGGHSPSQELHILFTPNPSFQTDEPVRVVFLSRTVSHKQHSIYYNSPDMLQDVLHTLSHIRLCPRGWILWNCSGPSYYTNGDFPGTGALMFVLIRAEVAGSPAALPLVTAPFQGGASGGKPDHAPTQALPAVSPLVRFLPSVCATPRKPLPPKAFPQALRGPGASSPGLRPCPGRSSSDRRHPTLAHSHRPAHHAGSVCDEGEGWSEGLKAFPHPVQQTQGLSPARCPVWRTV